jgi:hypothetical protein
MYWRCSEYLLKSCLDSSLLESSSVVCSANRRGSKGGGGVLLIFFPFYLLFQHCFICRLSDSTVSEDAVKFYHIILSYYYYYYKGLGVGSTVTMRRSASVPCKRDRDSISSGKLNIHFN